MQDLESKRMGSRQMGLLVLVDIVSVIALLAIGYFWMEGRFKELEGRIDTLSAQQAREDKTTDSPIVNPPVAAVTEYKSKKGVIITVDTPLSNATVKSPLVIKGKAPGNWFFEGQFSVSLKDSSGKVVAKGPTDISENWQTAGQVDFTATLTWDKAVSGVGILVFEKSNASGLPEHDDSVEIPIKF